MSDFKMVFFFCVSMQHMMDDGGWNQKKKKKRSSSGLFSMAESPSKINLYLTLHGDDWSFKDTLAAETEPGTFESGSSFSPTALTYK